MFPSNEIVRGYDSTFLNTTFRASGSLKFSCCVNSQVYLILENALDILCDPVELVEKFTDEKPVQFLHVDSNWSIYDEMYTTKATYAACINSDGQHVHDALPIMIDSQLEVDILYDFVSVYIQRKTSTNLVWFSLEALVSKMTTCTPVTNLTALVYNQLIGSNRVRKHLCSVYAGCFIVNGRINYSVMREVNKNLRCHTLLTEENVISFIYERLSGAGHKMFIRYSPKLDEIVQDECKLDTTAEAAKFRGDESWCEYGTLYWRNSSGVVSELDRNVFENIYLAKCAEPEFERQYESFIHHTYAYMLSTSMDMVNIDDFKNKILVSYTDALASMFDKSTDSLYNPSIWKHIVHRGLLMDCISKTISSEADPLFCRQMNKRSDRQNLLNNMREEKTGACRNTISSSSSGRHLGSSGGDKVNWRCTENSYSLLSPVIHSVTLIRYMSVAFQRSKQKKSKRRHTTRVVPNDALGYICNVNTGSMTSAGKKLYPTSDCVRSSGFLNSNYSTSAKLTLCQIVSQLCCGDAAGKNNNNNNNNNVTVHFFWNNKPLETSHFVAHFDRTAVDVYTWFLYNVWYPVKQSAASEFVEILLVDNVLKENSFYVNASGIDGVLMLRVPGRMIDTSLSECPAVQVSRSEMEQLVYLKNISSFSKTIPTHLLDHLPFSASRTRLSSNDSKFNQFYALNVIRRAAADINARVVQLANEHIVNWYDSEFNSIPMSSMVKNLISVPPSYNDAKRQSSGINCVKTMCASVDHLDASRLINLSLQFFMSPRTVSRTDLDAQQLYSWHARENLVSQSIAQTMPILSAQNSYTLRSGFANIAGANVDDAIIVHSGLNMDVHAMFKVSVGIRFDFVSLGVVDNDDYAIEAYLDSHTSLSMPRVVNSLTLDAARCRAVSSNAVPLYTVLKRDPTTRKPLAVIVPIAELYCNKTDAVQITFDVYTKYIVERYGAQGNRYQVYQLFDDPLFMNTIDSIERGHVSSDKIFILRHDHTRRKLTSVDKNKNTTTTLESTIRLEFVVRTPHFDTMKLGSQHAQKGLIKVMDLKPYFVDPITMPMVIHNITTILSRNASGQYLDLLRNASSVVQTTSHRSDDNMLLTGMTPVFQMNTYTQSLLSPLRLDISTQYAMCGHKMALTYQHVKALDITNPNSNAIPSSMAHILKMYQCVNAKTMFRTSSSDNNEEWMTNVRYIDKELVSKMRHFLTEFRDIFQKPKPSSLSSCL